jgi:hypothetical protein
MSSHLPCQDRDDACTMVKKSKTEQVAANALSCDRKSGCMGADYKCSEREQFETVAPIDRQMACCLLRFRAPTSRAGVFRPCTRLPHPRHRLLILSFSSLICSDALLVGIAMHPVCVAAMPFCFRISLPRWLGSSSWFLHKFQN